MDGCWDMHKNRHRSTQPCIPLNWVPALTGWGKGGNVTSAGWQVTLCDPIWHASSRSGAMLVAQTAIRFLTLHVDRQAHYNTVLPYWLSIEQPASLTTLSIPHSLTSFPSRRSSCLERSTASHNIYTISVYFLQSSEDSHLSALLSLTVSYRAWAVTLSFPHTLIIRHRHHHHHLHWALHVYCSSCSLIVLSHCDANRSTRPAICWPTCVLVWKHLNACVPTMPRHRIYLVQIYIVWQKN